MDRKAPSPFARDAQPVKERRAETPTAARAVGQTAIVLIVALGLVAALLWLLVPFGG